MRNPKFSFNRWLRTAGFSLLVAVTGASAQQQAETAKALPDGLYANIKTAKGDILIRLFYQEAPMTVMNFVGLAEGVIKNDKPAGKHFYDGLTFHRVEKKFVIQGGCPRGNGSGGPGYQFPNEIHPALKHDGPGTVAMANSGPHTNGCQFYITQSATPHLDGGYSVFGKVEQGQSVIDAITVGDKIESITVRRIGADAESFAVTDEAFKKAVAARLVQIAQEVTTASANAAPPAKVDKNGQEPITDAWSTPITTASGLVYVVTRKGNGPKAAKGTSVKAHYTGYLLDGRVFDSSVQRNSPFEFPVGMGRVIKGWDEAFLDMQKGEKRVLVIPPDLGYGSRGSGRMIRPNTTLIFDVELLDF